jgi:hypothetical protein
MRISSLGVVVLSAVCALSPPAARAGLIPVRLIAGLPGSSAPTATGGFQFEAPSGQVAVTELNVGDTATAATAGGSAFFGGAGTPVLLDVSDGGALLSSSNAPGGPAGGPLASGLPEAGADVPPAAARLGVSLADPAGDGTRALTARVTTADGAEIGTGSVAVPAGGWWVLGLGPGDVTEPTPPIDPPPVVVPPAGPSEPSEPSGPPPSAPGPVATPEPATAALALVGLPAALAVRLAARRRGQTAGPGGPPAAGAG